MRCRVAAGPTRPVFARFGKVLVCLGLALAAVYAADGVHAGLGVARAQQMPVAATAPVTQEVSPSPVYLETLPPPVVDMVELLLEFTQTCDVELLFEAIELNEIPPDFGVLPPSTEPVTGEAVDNDRANPLPGWQALGGSGVAGVSAALSVLHDLLQAAPGLEREAAPTLFVWPATSANDGAYSGPALVIDAEGVWHKFTLGERFDASRFAAEPSSCPPAP